MQRDYRSTDSKSGIGTARRRGTYGTYCRVPHACNITGQQSPHKQAWARAEHTTYEGSPACSLKISDGSSALARAAVLFSASWSASTSFTACGRSCGETLGHTRQKHATGSLIVMNGQHGRAGLQEQRADLLGRSYCPWRIVAMRVVKLVLGDHASQVRELRAGGT